MNEDRIIIDKEGNTYTAYEKMKKIWAGTRLREFIRRWLGGRRTANK